MPITISDDYVAVSQHWACQVLHRNDEAFAAPPPQGRHDDVNWRTATRKLIVLCAAVAALSCPSLSDASAGVIADPGRSTAVDTDTLLQDARLFCYNRSSGRFLHWGRCGGYANHPRVYCKNRYTGRFIHWGAC